MTNQDTRGAENQSHDLPTPLMAQSNRSVPTAEQPKRNTSGNENTGRPSERKSFFWLSIVFDALLFLVTSVYAFFAYHQWQAMNRQVEIFKTQAEVMSRQLESMNSSSAQTERIIKANESLVGQNKELVTQAAEQTKASLTQAEATRTQAHIAQQSFYIGDRPYVGAKNAEIDKFEAGGTSSIVVVFENSGKTPAFEFQAGAIVNVDKTPDPDVERVSRMSTAELLAIDRNTRPYPLGEIKEAPSTLLAGALIQFRVRVGELTAETVAKIRGGEQFLFVWGGAIYNDGLSKSHVLKFCFFYDPIEDEFVKCPTFNSTE